MDNSITIDEGEQKIKGGKVVIRRLFTLSEDGDYETGTIKYNELFYDIDKSISALGEEENEKWILINKRDLKDVPTTDFLAYFHILLKDYQKKELDLLEELKKHLKKVNIKFEEGDWQSFPDNFNKNKPKPLVKSKLPKLFDPILSSRPVLKLFNVIDQFKYLLIFYALIFIVSFELSLIIFGFIFFSLFGLACLFLAFEMIRENKTFKSVIPSMGYVVVGLYCLYLSYGAIIGLL